MMTPVQVLSLPMTGTKSLYELLVLPQLDHSAGICILFLSFWLIYGLVYLVLQSASKWFPRLSRVDQQDAVIRIVAGWHALSIVVIATYALFTEGARLTQSIYASGKWTTLCCVDMVAYFYWDLSVLIFLQPSLAFTIHALACMFVYTIALQPYLQFWALGFILYELSTPFVHVRRLLIYMNKTSTAFFQMVQGGFALAFAITRIFIGLPATVYWFVKMTYALPYEIPQQWLVNVLGLCAIALSALNIYWFGLLIKQFWRSRYYAD
jgi:hypothetical protein